MLCLPLSRELALIVKCITSWVRTLTKAGIHGVVGVRVLTRVFNEVHTLVDVM